MLDRAWPRRTAPAVIAAAAGVAYGWQADRDTLETYYAAAVRSMAASVHRGPGPGHRLAAGAGGLTRVETVTALNLENASYGERYLAASQTSAVAADFIFATGREVLPIGRFTGVIPSATLSQLRRGRQRTGARAERHPNWVSHPPPHQRADLGRQLITLIRSAAPPRASRLAWKTL